MSKALDLLRRLASGDNRGDFFISLELLKEVEAILAQPEQEPVAWMNDSGGCFLSDGNKYSENWTALYTSPPKREPLSDEEIYTRCCAMGGSYTCIFIDGVEWAEHQHGIRSFDDE